MLDGKDTQKNGVDTRLKGTRPAHDPQSMSAIRRECADIRLLWGQHQSEMAVPSA